MNPLPLRLSILTIMALAGCATTPGDCDPSRADFFNNTACLASGSYAQRQQTMEATLVREQGANQAFREVLAGLETEQAQVKGQLRTREAQYAKLDAAWRNLKQRLARESANNQALRARIATLDREVKARKRTDAAPDPGAKRATRDDLRLQVSLLEQELAAGVYR